MEDFLDSVLNYNKDNNVSEEDMEREIREKIREGFISKVYGIISYQIFITLIIVYLGLVNSWFQNLLFNSTVIFFANIAITFVCLILPIFCPQIYQKVPTNYIILTIFTISYSCIVSAETCFYTVSSVMISLFLTLITVLALTYYARKTKTDFTITGGSLFVSSILLIVSCLFFILFRIPFFNLIIMFLSLVSFSIYLIYDTQLLIGKRRNKFSEDDYILAAINIYIDIVVLFLKILRLFGEKKKEKEKKDKEKKKN